MAADIRSQKGPYGIRHQHFTFANMILKSADCTDDGVCRLQFDIPEMNVYDAIVETALGLDPGKQGVVIKRGFEGREWSGRDIIREIAAVFTGWLNGRLHPGIIKSIEQGYHVRLLKEENEAFVVYYVRNILQGELRLRTDSSGKA